MTRPILLGASAIIVVLLTMFGPELLGIYQLERFIASSSDADRTDGGPWPRLTDVCSGCHGDKGNAQDQRYPRLADEPAPYIATQLHNFASGARANPNMSPLAMTMSDGEIRLVSNYFAKQPAIANTSFRADPSLREEGRRLVAKGSCAACHGDRMMGRDQFPRLAGQGYDYLVAQLDAFAAGRRSEPTGMMKQLAQAASPAERKAMAAYLAALNPENETMSQNAR